MKKIAVLLAAAMLILFSGCAQPAGSGSSPSPAVTATPAPTPEPTPTPTLSPTPEPTPALSPSATDESMTALAAGSFDGNVYTNDFFGFTLTKPDSFVIAPEDRAETLRQSYAHMLPVDAPNLYISFLIAHQAPGSVDVGELFLLSAKLDDSLSSLTPEQFVGKVADNASTVQFGGVDFGTASMNFSIGQITVTDRFCVTIRNGWALVFVLDSTDNDEAALLDGIMKTIQFK